MSNIQDTIISHLDANIIIAVFRWNNVEKMFVYNDS